MGHHVTQGGHEDVGVHHFDGVNAAVIAIDQGRACKRQLAIPRLPAGGAVGITGDDPAFIEENVLTGAVKAAHSPHPVRNVRRGRIVRIKA
jgi:hypothetical protein